MNWLKLMTTLLVALVAASATTGHAEPRLLHASPPPDAVVSSPRRITLFFSEPLEVRRSRVQVTSADGQVARTRTIFYSNTRTISVRPLENLRPATYRVSWRVLGRRGGYVDGAFSIKIR